MYLGNPMHFNWEASPTEVIGPYSPVSFLSLQSYEDLLDAYGINWDSLILCIYLQYSTA